MISRSLTIVALAVSLAAGSAAGASGAENEPPPASATPTRPAESPSPPPPEAPDAITPSPSAPSVELPPATVDSPRAHAVVHSTFTVTGTGVAGSGIIVVADDAVCTAVVGSDSSWSCALAGVTSAPAVTITVEETTGEDAETARSVTSSVEVAVLGAPTVAAPGSAPVTGRIVTGTAYPGAEVTAEGHGFSCTSEASSAGVWFCQLPENSPTGEVTITATQVTSWSRGYRSQASEPQTVVLDTTAPEVPTLTAPALDAPLPRGGVRFSGDAEDGVTVTVFADAKVLCEGAATDGGWSCTAEEVADGEYTVSLLAQDEAGNSTASATWRAIFGRAGSAPPPTAPAAPPPLPSESESGTVPPPSPAPDIPQGGDDSEAAPPPARDVPTPADPWTASTRFSSAIVATANSTPAAGLGLALGVAAGSILLVALPSRLLAGALTVPGGGMRERKRIGGHVTGRNRSRAEFDRAPDVRLGNRFALGAAVVSAAVLALFAAPVEGEPAFIRLIVAMTVGVAVVNVAATALPAIVARRWWGIRTVVRLEPRLLVVAAAATLAARALDLAPAIIFCLVATVGTTTLRGTARAGRVAAVQLVSLMALGTAAWVLSAAVPLGPDVVGRIGMESLNTIALGGLGTAAVLALPLGPLPGRALWRWSRARWALAAAAVYTLAAGITAVRLDTEETHTATTILLLFGAFAAVCLAAWLWKRLVAEHSDRP